jgi:hypothetical protein
MRFVCERAREAFQIIGTGMEIGDDIDSPNRDANDSKNTRCSRIYLISVLSSRLSRSNDRLFPYCTHGQGRSVGERSPRVVLLVGADTQAVGIDSAS